MKTIQRRHKISILCLVLLVAMLLPMLATRPVQHQQARLQPALRALAAAEPESRVRVIVQQTGDGAGLEALVAELGGAVIKRLELINAFAAEMPAGATPMLAGADGVRWLSLDAPVESADWSVGVTSEGSTGSSSNPTVNTYPDTLRVRQVWNMGLKGEGITVAVIDSGITKDKDFETRPNHPAPQSRILVQRSFNSKAVHANDPYGHGTHVAGIVGGSGYISGASYAGIAPKVNLIGLKISDETGMAYESDTVEAMQWVLENKTLYNIRVVNLSVNSTAEQSYHTSPLNAAAEILWFNGIVVVVSAGNSGNQTGYNTVAAAPANDPFVITVGASDEYGTASTSDDTIAGFSASGTTLDGFAKPDIIAPGRNIISVLAATSAWNQLRPDRTIYVNGLPEYFRLSGTSMSAPMVSGAVALMLQDEPHLTPDQVKFRLMNSGRLLNGYAYLDVYAAVTGTTTQSANTSVAASRMLWTGNEPVMWNSVNWNSVNWNSVNWNSVNWNSVNWNSVNWNSVNWND